MHSSLTMDRLMEAANRRHYSLDNPGFCIACGAQQNNCEPDAVNYKCDNCGEKAVAAPESLLLQMHVAPNSDAK